MGIESKYRAGESVHDCAWFGCDCDAPTEYQFPEPTPEQVREVIKRLRRLPVEQRMEAMGMEEHGDWCDEDVPDEDYADHAYPLWREKP